MLFVLGAMYFRCYAIGAGYLDQQHLTNQSDIESAAKSDKL